MGCLFSSQATSGDVVKLHVSRTFLSKLANDPSRNHQEFIEVDAHAQFSGKHKARSHKWLIVEHHGIKLHCIGEAAFKFGC